MPSKYNPIHAAACGIATGFVVFAIVVLRSGSFWPSAAVSELGLKILIVTSVLFAIAAIVKNRMIERDFKEEQARRAAHYRRMHSSM